MDKQKIIPYTIKRIQKLGLSENIKRDILENASCVLREDICGEYATLKKILPKEDIEEIKAMLRRRKVDFLTSANKVPKSLQRYVKV